MRLRNQVLYEEVVEVEERVQLLPPSLSSPLEQNERIGVTGERVRILKPLARDKLKKELQRLHDKGIRSVAVVLMHSYTFPGHEREVGAIAAELGFKQVSLSSSVMSMVKIVPRGFTTTADAYLTPVIKTYLNSFCSGFANNLEGVQVSFMQSDGGLTPLQSFSGHKAILSGPAGGVVGYASSTYWEDDNGDKGEGRMEKQALIGFDMGGTSTDVSRYSGVFEHVYETTTAGITIQAPQLDINTVAAGGGSRLFYRSGLLLVGPESAGAHPGPVCYRKKGGKLAVTDANVVLGRVIPEYFPKIFGEDEKQPLDVESSRRAFEELAREINADREGEHPPLSVDEVAFGFIKVANEAMCRPIRNLTQMKGYDITKHILACFGGAGPQHACAIAKSLGMKKIFIHRFSGILSAFGLSMADVVVERQEPAALHYGQEKMDFISSRLLHLQNACKDELVTQGFDPVTDVEYEFYLNLRYEGTDNAVMTMAKALPSDFAATFFERYKREYGFTLSGRSLIVDDFRVRGIGRSGSKMETELPVSTKKPEPRSSFSTYFEEGGRQDIPVFFLADLTAGDTVMGPAIIMQNVSTVVVEPGCTAKITRYGDLQISVEAQGAKQIDTALDPIQLSIFSHRFMGIAEQMGRTLQRTSISVNIKERLDFSCALFGPDGGLVANAPHLPVHLGAMQEAVKFQLKYWGDDLEEGDVLVSNHPQLAGGSHLPDITVITPVFNEGKIVFFVAARGHHADIGGIAPGSMPPLSRTLEDEGAAIVAFKLVKGADGLFDTEGITRYLMAPGELPGNSGTRNLRDNLSDLKAQVAANNKGVQLMRELIDEYSLPVVHAYMNYIQQTAEKAVREMLRDFSVFQGLAPTDSVASSDLMDDGSQIKLTVTINREDGSAVFDFTGTDPEVYGNINAPPAVSYSAIIYCLRCMLVGSDIPLNQGVLAPVSVIIPKGSLLNPSDRAAVVGGNVLTSQRVTDVVLKTFKVCAASQGCMNNLTFGDAELGYYETIAGGAGAGPHWNGRSGVHTHMTNTRITDPEILERRYPVILQRFSLRPDSGGSGAFRGGDGVIRELEFLKPLTVSILSERRVTEPYGMAGGEPGARGKNLLIKEGRVISLGGKNTVDVKPGERLVILSPGGGGYGPPDSELAQHPARPMATGQTMTSGSLLQYQMLQESA